MSKICELNIPNWLDRCELVSILANAGYKVSIEERDQKDTYFKKDYFVIIEDKENV